MSTKNSYRLINPHIEGTMNTVVKAKNSFSAGKKLYGTVSRHFTNHVDDFYMTIQNVENKELTHFKIDEKRNNNNVVDYHLVKLDNNFTPELEQKLISSVENVNTIFGGKKHKKKDDDDSSDSSSSSSSSSDSAFYYKVPKQEINRFSYFYLPYYKLNFVGVSPMDMYRIFVPTFNLPINPTIEIIFDLYKFN